MQCSYTVPFHDILFLLCVCRWYKAFESLSLLSFHCVLKLFALIAVSFHSPWYSYDLLFLISHMSSWYRHLSRRIFLFPIHTSFKIFTFFTTPCSYCLCVAVVLLLWICLLYFNALFVVSNGLLPIRKVF